MDVLGWCVALLTGAAGTAAGVYVERMRIRLHRMRAGMRQVMPTLKMLGTASLMLVVLLGCGIVWLGWL